MFPTAGVRASECLVQAVPRLVYDDGAAFRHRLKCVPSPAYRLTTFYLTRRLLFWYTFGCRKVCPDACRGFSFYGVRQPRCRFSFVLAGLATRFASDPFVSYISYRRHPAGILVFSIS